jgi:hypothetical protein
VASILGANRSSTSRDRTASRVEIEDGDPERSPSDERG